MAPRGGPAFPTIPTVADARILSVLATSPAGTHTSPNLSSLRKAAGDLLIAIVIIYDGNSTNAEFSAWGGGFTELPVGGDNAGTATMGIGVAYKFSTGEETGTFTVTSADTSTNDSAFFLLSISGAHETSPPEAGSFVTGTGSAADPGSFNPPGWDAEQTLWIAVGASGEDALTGSFTGVASGPANFTGYVDSGISADAIGGVEGAVAFLRLDAASLDVGTFSVDTSNARNAALVIAVRPSGVTYTRQQGDSFPPGRRMPRKQLRDTAGEATGAATIQQALTATVTTTATFLRSVGKFITATATSTASIVKQVGKIVSTTVTSTATMAVPRLLQKALTATVTSTATIVKSVGKLMSATVTSTASMTRQVGKVLSATVTSTATMVRQVGKILSATITTTATLLAQKVILKALTATVTSTATITKQVNKLVSATVTSTATIVRQVGKVLSATVTSTASIATVKVKLLALTATVTSSATMVRQIGLHLSAIVTSTASIVKQVGKRITFTVTSTASIVAQKVILKTLTATVTTTATITRSVSKSLSAAVTTTSAMTRQVGKLLSGTVTSTASLVADAIIAGAVQVLGYFGMRPRGSVRSRPSEGDFGGEPGAGAGGDPAEADFDTSPGGEMD
jgi:hypothetical protein